MYISSKESPADLASEVDKREWKEEKWTRTYPTTADRVSTSQLIADNKYVLIFMKQLRTDMNSCRMRTARDQVFESLGYDSLLSLSTPKNSETAWRFSVEVRIGKENLVKSVEGDYGML